MCNGSVRSINLLSGKWPGHGYMWSLSELALQYLHMMEGVCCLSDTTCPLTLCEWCKQPPNMWQDEHNACWSERHCGFRHACMCESLETILGRLCQAPLLQQQDTRLCRVSYRYQNKVVECLEADTCTPHNMSIVSPHNVLIFCTSHCSLSPCHLHVMSPSPY